MVEAEPLGPQTLHNFLATAEVPELAAWTEAPPFGATQLLGRIARRLETPPQFPPLVAKVGQELDPKDTIPASREFCSLLGRPLGIVIHPGELTLRGAYLATAVMLPERLPLQPSKARLFLWCSDMPSDRVFQLIPDPVGEHYLVRASVNVATSVRGSEARLERLRQAIAELRHQLPMPPTPRLEALDPLRLRNLLALLFDPTLADDCAGALLAKQVRIVEQLCQRLYDYRTPGRRGVRHDSTPQIRRLWLFCQGATPKQIGDIEGIQAGGMMFALDQFVKSLRTDIAQDEAGVREFLAGEDPDAEINLATLPPKANVASGGRQGRISRRGDLSLRWESSRYPAPSALGAQPRAPSRSSVAARSAKKPVTRTPRAADRSADEKGKEKLTIEEAKERLPDVMTDIAKLNTLSNLGTSALVKFAVAEVDIEELGHIIPTLAAVRGGVRGFLRFLNKQESHAFTAQHIAVGRRFFGLGKEAPPGMPLKDIVQELANAHGPNYLKQEAAIYLYEFCEGLAAWLRSKEEAGSGS